MGKVNGAVKSSGKFKKKAFEGVPKLVRERICERADGNKNRCTFSDDLDPETRQALSRGGFRIEQVFDYDGFTSYPDGYKVSW